MKVEQLDTLYGTMFVPDNDTGQYWWLKTTGGSPEHEMIEMVCGLLDEKERGVALDCGANFGCWSLALAPHAKAVFAFEPQPFVYDLLARTAASNPERRFTPIMRALGSRPDEMIEIPDLSAVAEGNYGGVSIGIPHSECPDAPMAKVRSIRLDSIFDDLAPVSFIKADVEGSELELLKGATRIIKAWKPILIVECDHPLTDTQALGAFIESLGYNVEIAQDNNFIGMPI